jgi:NAD(P)-dependent dehydrogenase (short-subunit alcohol dehydrogenase family)
VVPSSTLFDHAPERVALVTGAASGIGAATAVRLAEEGVGGVVLVDLDEARLRDVARTLSIPGPRVLTRAHDVADEAAWQATAGQIADRFGRLDLAVANAGIADSGPIVEYGLQAWRRVMAANLDGVFLTLRCSLKLMQQGHRGGAVVVVVSAAAIKAEVGTAAYGASKAGALQLARIAAKEGAPDRIRVNAVLPGGVKTPIWQGVPFFQDLVDRTGSEEAAFAEMAAMATPLGRYATAEEIADQIAWPLSDRAAGMTGAAMVIDGGYSL